MKDRIIDTLKKVVGRIINGESELQLQPIPVRVNNRFGR